MKLYNKTKCPQKLLTAVLIRAARACGQVRSTGVVVKVTQGTTGRINGIAHECDWVYEWSLRTLKSNRNPRRKCHVKGRAITTDHGYFSITLPGIGHNARMIWMDDPLVWAEQFYRVAVHEWGHVRDYQAGGSFKLSFDRSRKGYRRAAHDSRPEERRAIRYVNEAKERVDSGVVQSPDEAILALALWLDENNTGREPTQHSRRK